MEFSKKKNMHSLSFFLSYPTCSLLPLPYCCLHLKIAQRKLLSSLTSSEQFALLSSYGGEKGRWCVSCESVRVKINVCISLRGCIKSELGD